MSEQCQECKRIVEVDEYGDLPEPCFEDGMECPYGCQQLDEEYKPLEFRSD